MPIPNFTQNITGNTSNLAAGIEILRGNVFPGSSSEQTPSSIDDINFQLEKVLGQGDEIIFEGQSSDDDDDSPFQFFRNNIQ